MEHGTFIWADLSTFRQSQTEAFYSTVMGWSFSDGLASLRGKAVAQLYTMPEKFQKIGMPSFWMSYLVVGDIAQTIELAKSLGGKVELGPEPFEQGQIALIRDPLGAGFTVYAGPELGEVATGPGSRVGHGLFVSDATQIAPFYEALFGWTFGDANDSSIQSVTKDSTHLFYCHTVPDPNVRGKEEYWAVFFQSEDLASSAEKVQAVGGQVVAKTALPEGDAIVMSDPDGGTFFLIETGQTASAQSVAGNSARSVPWKAWLGLALVIYSSVTTELWPWLIFLGIWVAVGLRDKETYLFQCITRANDGPTYWAILATYSALFLLVFTLMLGGS